MSACKPGLLPTEEAGKPKVTLERVEIQSYFPGQIFPPVPHWLLAYVFNIDNPSGYNVKLDNFKFTTYFEATPANILSHDPNYLRSSLFPTPNNQPVSGGQYLRFFHDQSESGGGTMLRRFRHLNLKPAEVIKNWYTKIGDFSFGIKVSEGMAVFSSDKGDIFVPFEGNFPKEIECRRPYSDLLPGSPARSRGAARKISR